MVDKVKGGYGEVTVFLYRTRSMGWNPGLNGFKNSFHENCISSYVVQWDITFANVRNYSNDQEFVMSSNREELVDS